MSEKKINPFCDSDVVLEEIINVSELRAKYNEKFKIDVGRFFVNVESVKIYRCIKTGYRFYYPFSISGDALFYNELEKFDWYYQNWKWEHEIASKLISEGQNILEIGCGRAFFLKKVKELKKNVTLSGIELNNSAIIYAKEKFKLDIKNQLIEDFVKDNEGIFDFVCLFQVLEHIANVNTFINSSVDSLKPGGLLFISVPNNRAFPSWDHKEDTLNHPPHHMGLWDQYSLKNIETVFDVDLIKIFYEPLRKEHIEWYHSLFVTRYLKSKRLRIWYYRLRIWKCATFFIKTFSFCIKGHTIAAVFKKKIIE